MKIYETIDNIKNQFRGNIEFELIVVVLCWSWIDFDIKGLFWAIGLILFSKLINK